MDFEVYTYEEDVVMTLNRFHRLALWCRNCNNYWQTPNYLVVLHGSYVHDTITRLLKINLYLYGQLFDMQQCDFDEAFRCKYNFEEEVHVVFQQIREILRTQTREINILDIDLIASLDQNMPALTAFVLQMKSSFDLMAQKIIENSPRNFLSKLDKVKKNVLRSLETKNLKCAIDNLMDLNIAGLDVLVQCVGLIFNCFYVLSINIQEPEKHQPGMMYCTDTRVIVERLANISAQNFLYKYKRRWLVYYREVLSECKNLFGTDLKTYEELRMCGNYETIERVLYDLFITKNTELSKHLTIIKHIQRYPKTANDIYGWWSGRSKEQLQMYYNLLDDCLGMDKKSTLLPFILTHGMPVKDRLYCEIWKMLKMFDHINPELSSSLSFIMRIYPDVFEQVYFPDRDHYMAMNGGDVPENAELDVLDNIRNKNILRKCENTKCQERYQGRNVIWNLNTFEVGKHSMNTIFKELIKHPTIFEEIRNYAQKNLDIAVNANAITRKTKIVYR